MRSRSDRASEEVSRSTCVALRDLKWRNQPGKNKGLLESLTAIQLRRKRAKGRPRNM